MSDKLTQIIELVEEYGLDQVRYFLLREVPFGNDGDFSPTAMISRVNSDLSNDYGNLVQRTISMIYKNCDQKIPVPDKFTDQDSDMIATADTLLDYCREKMNVMAFNQILEEIWRVVRKANAYVDLQAPWSLKKTHPDCVKRDQYSGYGMIMYDKIDVDFVEVE